LRRVSDLDVRLMRVSPLPLYHQLARQLEAAIEAGRLPKGEFLGNEVELAEAWHVSRPTVRRAIQELVSCGLLVRRRGVGTQVVNDQVRRPVRLSSLYDDLAEQGRRPTTQLLVLRRERATSPVAEALSVGVGTEVVHVERVRAAGATKLAVLRNWLTVEAGGELTADQLEANGLYALIRARGVRPHYATQRVGAVAASPTDAPLLGLEPGAPLVTMRRVMQDDTGRVVELGEHVYDAAHYAVEMTVIDG
jgi:DNA-binding GntR family transcriptional regulator